jgi:monoterpene epsilon-lactone hydrolase
MDESAAERRIRSGLPFVRFMQDHLPPAVMQALLRRSAARARPGSGATREEVTADGVPCVWIVPPGGGAGRTLLYLHGGGFVYGLTPLHIQMCALLAGKIRARVLLADYRLAPDHPFPAALEDSLAAYRWLLKQNIPAGSVALAGDSAGGNLVLAAMLALRAAGEPLPAAAVCLSPATDLTGREKAPAAFEDPILTPKAVRFYNRAYVAGQDARNPLISPVYGDLRGLPPLLVHVGEDELLRDDAERIARRAESAGVAVRLEIFPRMWHVFQLNRELPQAVESLDDIAQFLEGHFPPSPPTP